MATVPERDADLSKYMRLSDDQNPDVRFAVNGLFVKCRQARDERDAAKAEAAKWMRRFDLELDRAGETMKTLRDEDTDRLRDRFMRTSTPGERFILLLDALEDTRDALARLAHAERDRDAAKALYAECVEGARHMSARLDEYAERDEKLRATVEQLAAMSDERLPSVELTRRSLLKRLHVEMVIQAAAQVLSRAALALIERDPHQWSTRPCGTCASISAILGEPFGCIKKARQEGGHR